MTLSDLASVGSLVSGMAVLISLIFLYFQLRQVSAQLLQTEKNQRALMNQGVVNRASETVRWLAEPQMSDLLNKVTAGETQFTGQELVQLRMQMRNLIVHNQDTYVQHNSGLADQITLESTLRPLKSVLAQPVNRALWKSDRTHYAPEWMAYIDKLIEETPLAKPVDPFARFKANLAEVMR